MQEVNTLQKDLKMQQITAKRHRKISTTYFESIYEQEIPAMYAQEVNTVVRNSDNQPKTLAKDRNMSNSTTSSLSTNSYNEKIFTTKKKDYSSTSDSVCTSNIYVLHVKFSFTP